MPWYSGDGGILKLGGAIGSAVNDVRRVRRAPDPPDQVALPSRIDHAA